MSTSVQDCSVSNMALLLTFFYYATGIIVLIKYYNSTQYSKIIGNDTSELESTNMKYDFDPFFPLCFISKYTTFSLKVNFYQLLLFSLVSIFKKIHEK